jgi:alkanesulfonate monooxygenase SsuD/methylene tetrahydromethanopterin reductase-like flavin-dependent oxidoreductase (luciferase family)
MTTKADFTDEEWARLGRSPLVAGMAISIADPGGPIEALKETSAALKTVLDAAQSGKHGEFVQSVAADVAAKAQQRENPLAGFKPKGSQASAEVLDELRAVNQLLVDKTTPEETEQFREWLKEASQQTALAAKEGGFLGFRAVRVSEGEQEMLDRLAEVFS